MSGNEGPNALVAHVTDLVPEWQRHPGNGRLSAAELEQLRRIMDRLLPGDKSQSMPGAVDAGAAEFVSLLLAKSPETTFHEITEWRVLYPAALAALDQWSQTTQGTPLANLEDTKVEDILKGLENGTLAGLATPETTQKLWFKTFLRHMLQGCFGDPRWGGNKDKIMWRALGYLQTPETSEQITNDPRPAIPL